MRLAVHGLHVALGGRPVLAGIDLVFEPGAITALVGPNGAGKSTLLACLAGLRRPDRGEVRLGEQAIDSLSSSERARSVALLPQGSEAHWNLDVRSVVALGRLPWRDYRRAASDPAVERAMARADVAHLAGRGVQDLSGGERARVLLARALAVEAPWILADEPLAGLDLLHQVEAIAAFRQEADAGVGVVLVLHDLTLAARAADHIVVLDAGQVAASAAPGAVFTEALMEGVYGVKVLNERLSDGAPAIVPLRRAAGPGG
jgi:iron complex transport system ATP-binding protein